MLFLFTLKVHTINDNYCQMYKYVLAILSCITGNVSDCRQSLLLIAHFV